MHAGDERRMAKKKRKLVLAGKGDKTDYFDVYGPEAKAEAIWKVPAWHPGLKLQDFKGLIAWMLADGMNPKWIFIKNKPLVSKIVLLFVPGLDAAFYTLNISLLQNLEICCGAPQAVREIADSASSIEGLLTCPLRKRKAMENDKVNMVEQNQTDADGKEQSEKARIPSLEKTEQSNRNSDGPSAQQLPEHYLLSEAEMQENGYPMAKVSKDGCSVQLPEDFVATRTPSGGSQPGMVAIDCEMCYTAAGLELARVSLVNVEGKILYDSLVKPTNPITNYNTRYSGITACMMELVTTTRKIVQEKLLEIVHEDVIIVGHSVEFDLMALKLIHMKVIDTALLYRYSGSRSKPALRVLASRYLDRRIQDQASGHDSVEDARAAMDLALLRINQGPLGTKSSKQESFLSVLDQHGRRCSMLDRSSMLRQFAGGSCNAITCLSDDEVVAKAAKEVKNENVDFVWAQLTELNAHRNWRSQSLGRSSGRVARSVSVETTVVKSDQEIDKTMDLQKSRDIEHVMTNLNNRVQILHDALPANAMLIVLTSSATRPWAKSQMRNANPEDVNNVGRRSWSCASILETLRTRPETALGFVTIKN